MKTLFIHAGYRLFTEKKKDSQKKISFSYILNSDGSVRWFWNTNSNKPLFLKFYNRSTFKSKIYSLSVRIAFSLHIQNLFFKKETVYYIKGQEPLFDIEGDWAIFTGTKGPSNKGLLYANASFYKIANTEKAKKLIQKESSNSRYAANSNYYTVPKTFLHSNYLLQLSDISAGGKRQNSFGEKHMKALEGMKERYQGSCKISDWGYFQKLIQDLFYIKDKRIPQNLLTKIRSILAEVDGNETVSLSFSHGNFTSWNCYEKRDSLAIYDWELASFERTKAFDFFHFIIQNGVLIDKKPWKEILEDIKINNAITFQMNAKELEKYLKFYLVTNALFNLKKYMKQENWHNKVLLLLQTWSEALNGFLVNTIPERELLVMDISDRFSRMNCETLQFHYDEPEKLKNTSDIDVVLSTEDTEELILYLSQHSLVRKISVMKKASVESVKVIGYHNEIVNIDLMSHDHWKNFHFLPHKKVDKTRTKNIFEVYNV